MTIDSKIREEAIQRYVDGESSYEVADALGVSNTSVCNWVVAAGYEIRSKSGVRTVLINEEVKEQAVAMYVDGDSSCKVAEVLGVSDRSVANWVMAAGYEMRSCKAPLPMDKIVEEYNSGMSTGQLSEKYGVGAMTIWNRLKAEGVEIRSAIDMATKHGHSRSNNGRPSPEYYSFTKMKDRCLNPNHVHYNRYGGNGVTICDRWLDKENGFSNFLADMGERPEGTTLDRYPDTKGNYEPSNCRWATPKEQRANQRFYRGGGAKLSNIQAAYVKLWLAEGFTQTAIAETFGVSIYVIHKIAQGKTYKDIQASDFFVDDLSNAHGGRFLRYVTPSQKSSTDQEAA